MPGKWMFRLYMEKLAKKEVGGQANYMQKGIYTEKRHNQACILKQGLEWIF